MGIATMIFSNNVLAADYTGALKKIKESGVLTLGVRDGSIPFSYLDEKQSYVGYSVDLCLKVAESIKKELELPNLQVKMVAVTPATRIPLIANGTTDISCDSATNNAERQKQVSFAVTEFVTATRFLSKKSANYKSIEDLRGKSVVASAGTSNLKVLIEVNKEKNLGMNITTGRDHAESFLLLETGRVAAFFNDDVLLAGAAANSRNPGDYVISEQAFSVEPYGLILPPKDAAFKKVVDQSLTTLYRSSEMQRIYAKWFQSPIPPKGINLNLAMSPQLQVVFKNPTDSPDPAAYSLEGAAAKK